MTEQNKKFITTKTQVLKAFPNGIEKFEIGSGTNPEPGYVPSDIQPSPEVSILADTRKLPLPDNFVREEVRAVHIMEHFCHPEFSSEQMRRNIGTTTEVLSEIYRVLSPGGRFFMVTPDYEKICISAANKKVSFDRLQRWTVGGHLNNFDVHHWLWTHADARNWFGEVGFVDLEDCNPVNGWKNQRKLDWQDPLTKPNQNWFKTEWHHWLFFTGTKPRK